MKGKSKGPPRPTAPTPGKGKGARSEDVEALHAACQFDDEAALESMFEVNSLLDPNNCSRRSLAPLHTAASNGSIRAVRFLLARGAFINATNSWSETPLHLAVTGGHMAVLTELVNSQAYLEAADKWGRTPLRVACEIHAQAMVDALIAAGASDSYANDVLGQAQSEADESQRAQQLQLTAEFMSYVKEHSPEVRSEPDVKQIFSTKATSHTVPLGPAVASRKALSKLVEYPGDPQAVALMLADSSVDPAGRDAFALTALHKFAAWDKVDLVKMLLPHLADSDINASDVDNGFSPLHHASSMGAIHTLELLVSEPRVNCEARDRSGRTPRELVAMTPGLEHIVDLYDGFFKTRQETVGTG